MAKSKSVTTTLKLKDSFSPTLKKITSNLKTTNKAFADFAKSVSRGTTEVESAINKMNMTFSKIKNPQSPLQGMTKSFNDETLKLVNATTDRNAKMLATMQALQKEKINPLEGMADKVKKEVDYSDTYVMQFANKLTSALNNMKLGAISKRNVVQDFVKQLMSDSKDSFGQLTNFFKKQLDTVSNFVDSTKSKLLSKFSNLGDGLSKSMNKIGLGKVTSKLSLPSFDLSGIGSKVSRELGAVGQLFSNFAGKIGSTLAPIKSTFANAFSGLGTVASSSLSGIGKLGASGFKAIASSASSMASAVAKAFQSASSSGDNFGSRMESTANKVSSTFKSVLGAIGVSKGIGMATSAIKESGGMAIDRFDTLQKFPKVMNSLGFSANDTKTSMQQLSDGIEGLPTTLQDIVAQTQQMASTTGNLKDSTGTVLGLNNAFLSSGSSVSDVSRGMTQFNQMLARGKVDMIGWHTLEETMPIAMKELAESFGFAGKSAKMDLYEALKDGNITFDQFTEKIRELGTGTGHLAKLAKINSIGIRTSFANLKNSISKGLATLLTQADSITQKLTGKSIASHIDSLKFVINKAFASMSASMEKAIPTIERVANSIKPFFNSVSKIKWGDLFKGIGDGIAVAITQLRGFLKTIEPITNAIKNVFTKIMGSVSGTGSTEEGVGRLLVNLTKFAIGWKVLAKVFKVLPAIKLPKFPTFGKKKTPLTPLQDLLSSLQLLAKGATGLALVWGTFKTLEQVAQSIQAIDKAIPNNMTNLSGKLLLMTTTIGSMTLGLKAIGNLVKENPASMIAGLLSLGGIALALVGVAKSLELVDKSVPDNFGNIMKKLGTIGVAITGMSVLAGTIGSLEVLTGGVGAVIAGAGLATIVGIAGAFSEMAKAIKRIDQNVPDDFGSVERKIQTMVDTVRGFGQISLGGFGQFFSNLGKSWNISTVSSAIDKLVDMAKSLNKLSGITIPDNIDSVIEKFQTVIQRMNNAKLGNFGNVFSNLFKADNIQVVSSAVDRLKGLAKALEGFGTISIPYNFGSVFENLKRVMQTVNNANLGGFTAGWFNGGKSWNTEKITGMIDNMKQLAKALEGFTSLTFPNVDGVINRIKNVMQSFNNADLGGFTAGWLNGFKSWNMDKITAIVEKMKTFSDDLKKLEKIDIKKVDVNKNITSIREAISQINLMAENVTDAIGGLKEAKLQADTLDVMSEIAKSYETLGNNFKSFEKLTFNPKSVEGNLIGIKNGIEQLKTSALELKKSTSESLAQLKEAEIKQDEYGAIEKIATSYENLGHSFDRMQTITFNPISVEGNISGIRSAIKQIADATTKIRSSISEIGTKDLSSAYDNISKAVASFEEIGNAFSRFKIINFDPNKLKTPIENISKAIQTLKIENFGNISDMVQASDLAKATQAIDALKQLPIKLEELASSVGGKTPAYTSIQGIVSGVKNALEQLNQLTPSLGNLPPTDGLNQAGVSIEALKTLVPKINAFANGDPVKFGDINLKISMIKNVMDALGTLRDSATNAVTSSDISMVSTALDSLKTLGDKINQSAPINTSVALKNVQDIKTLVDEIGKIAGVTLEPSIGGFDSLAGSMDRVRGASESLKTSLSTVGSTYQNMVSTISSANTGFSDSISAMMEQVKTTISQGMQGVVDYINQGTSQMASAFANGMNQSVNAVSAGKGRIVGAFSGLSGQLSSAGSQAMAGLTAGLNAGAGSAIATAESIANRISATVRKALDIHSPSRVFREIGGYVTTGLSLGLLDDLNKLDNASNAIAQRIVDPFNQGSSSSNSFDMNARQSVSLDDSEIQRLQASASQQVVIQNKQVVPQVTLNVENNHGEPVDYNQLLGQFEDIIVSAYNNDLG